MRLRTLHMALIAAVALAPALAGAQDAVSDGQAPVKPTTPAPNTVPSLPAAAPPVPAPPQAAEQPQGEQAPQAYDGAPAAPQAYAAPQAPAAPDAPVVVQYSAPQGPQVAPGPGGGQGQWVFTTQYGWIWTPYAQNYTYVDQVGELALTYAFYPSYGWRWLPSPWVLGFGPTPYWGSFGYSAYAWHARPWFSVGVYRPSIWQRWGQPYGGYNAYGAGYRHAYGYNGAYGGRPGPIISGPRPQPYGYRAPGVYSHPGGYGQPYGGGRPAYTAPVYSHPVYGRPAYSPPSYAPRPQMQRGPQGGPTRFGGAPPSGGHFGGMGGGAHFGGGGGGHHR